MLLCCLILDCTSLTIFSQIGKKEKPTKISPLLKTFFISELNKKSSYNKGALTRDKKNTY